MDPISAPDLNKALNETWPFGEVESIVGARIGEEFGFGGAVDRLSVATTTGPATLIAKSETPEQVERVVAAYARMGDALDRRVPELYGHTPTVSLFEDVSPASQGDGLDVQPPQVARMVQLLAHLHAVTRTESEVAWSPEPWSDQRWSDRITLARERYPGIVDERTLNRLARLHSEVPDAIEALRSGPQALIHMDSGYDNTLWRPDGSIVLLDWSNARVGPIGYDLATHVTETEPAQVLEWYRGALRTHGKSVHPSLLVDQVVAGARILARGITGFAGLPDEPRQPRLRQFRDRALVQVRALLDWIDSL